MTLPGQHPVDLGIADDKQRAAAKSAELERRIEALERGSRAVTDDMVGVASVTLASPGAGNVAYTTLDVSAYVPAGTRAAILQVNCFGASQNDAINNDNYLSFRKDATSQLIAAAGLIGLRNENGAWIAAGSVHQVIVPLTSARTFQYSKTDGINAGSNADILLRGYLC